MPENSASGPIPEPFTGAFTAPTQELVSRHHPGHNPTGGRLAVLSLTALGVVYGDIGTSPLYALRDAFIGQYGLQPNQQTVYGVLSLIVWSLILIVSVKYIVFILRADNRGEGGILALLALLLQHERRSSDSRRRALLVGLGLFGAALLYGDGIITPAISVLSAVEGVKVATPALDRFVVLATVVILVFLFVVQRFGTARVGTAFGPIMAVWFITIAALGLKEIVGHPQILGAINPIYGMRFFQAHGAGGILILGAVVLAVTGAEALYADMGHFGKKPIRLAWFTMVFPCLLLNYFGQGALLLRDASAVENPFFHLAPRALLYPIVAIATLATIVASQALISGAFSLTQQSVQLGYSPRVTIVHTSAREAGQIYVPEINQALMVGCVVLVFAFGSSEKLAAAYGIAVTGTMAITSLLYYVVARRRWGWPPLAVGALVGLFLLIDLSFFGANAVKIEHGGWVPMAMALVIFTLMSTWKRGRQLLHDIMQKGALPIDLFLADVQRRNPPRVPGTAVFMTSASEGAPVVLLHHLKHNKVLHEKVILMSVQVVEVPEVRREKRIVIQELGGGVWRLNARYGFMETPEVPEVLALAAQQGLPTKPQDTSFFLGRERLLATGVSKMWTWRKKIFILMSRNARSATEYFSIPPNRVVELGAQIEF